MRIKAGIIFYSNHYSKYIKLHVLLGKFKVEMIFTLENSKNV